MAAKSADEFDTIDASSVSTKTELDADFALELCETILAKCDEMPDRAEDFTESVRENVESMRDSIEESRFATQGQIAALENMDGGLDRWLERA